MGVVSVNTFTSDTETVTRTKLNGLAANLLTEFNGNIDNDNIKAGAGILGSKLNLAAPGVIGSGTAAAGTFTVLTASTNLTLAAGATVTEIADEDDMSSDSATKLATQQSIKAYADGANEFFVGSLTRDTAAASGNVSYTGVGFTPKAVIFFGGATGEEWCIGADDGTNRHVLAHENVSTGSNDLIFIGDQSILISEAGSTTKHEGFIDSFDADGFTITWEKTGSPTGTATIKYLAIK